MKSKAYKAALAAVAAADGPDGSGTDFRSGAERRSGSDRRGYENPDNENENENMEAREMEAPGVMETQDVIEGPEITEGPDMMEADEQLQLALEVRRESRVANKQHKMKTAPRTAPASNTPPTNHWMNYVYSNEPTINDNELISLTALIAYVAHMIGQTEFRIERQFADRFNIPNVKCLPLDRYDDAVRYLVDQVPLFAA